MKSKGTNHFRSIIAHIVLIILSFMCLFFFYILFINATRSHADLQKGFSALPGNYFLENLKNVANVPGNFKQFNCFRLFGGNLHLFFSVDSLRPVCV